MRKPELDAITLRGMRFHTLVGVLPHEREHPQPLEVDLTAWITGVDIMDYRTLYADVRAAVEAPTVHYLEHLAESIARGTLRHPSIQRVRISVRKPHAAVGGPLQHAAVTIVRERGTKR